MDPFFSFVLANGEAIGLATIGILAMLAWLSGRLFTRAQVEVYKANATDWKNAHEKSELARYELLDQNRQMLDGLRTTNHLVESLRNVMNARKGADDEIV